MQADPTLRALTLALTFATAAMAQHRTHVLVRSNQEPDGWFSFQTDLENGIALVSKLPQRARGAAYLFDAATGVELFELVPSISSVNDDFGYAVALEGDYALVGGSGPERAFVFDLNGRGAARGPRQFPGSASPSPFRPTRSPSAPGSRTPTGCARVSPTSTTY